MPSKVPTPGRNRLFNDGDRVVHKDAKTGTEKFGTVLNYEPSARKLFVEFDGPKGKGSKKLEEWVSVAKVDRVNEKGKVIPKTPKSRSNSRGRADAKKKTPKTAPKAKSKSPSKKPSIASRTRSKSPARRTIRNADFSSADEAAMIVPKSRKKSPTKKKSPEKTPSRTRKTAATAPLQYAADFSADDEKPEDAQNITELIESNSLENQTKTTTATTTCLYFSNVCTFSKSCCNFMCTNLTALFSLLFFTIKTTLQNLPMFVLFMGTMYTTIWSIDKKNLRLSSSTKLPTLPIDSFSWTWLSSDLKVWKANALSLYTILKLPFVLSFWFYSVTMLQNWFAGYNVVIGSKPRSKSKVNLKKVWLVYLLSAAFILNAELLWSCMKNYVPVQANIVIDPITPCVSNLHSCLYNMLCMLYRQQAKIIFTLFGLALFCSYLDNDFDFPEMSLKNWFINESASENNVPLRSRFTIAFMTDVAIQVSLLILCSRNPNNYYLWIAFVNQAVKMFISVKDTDNEEQTLRRYHQSTSVSGYWFYFSHIIRFFVVLNFWRYTSKIEKIPVCKIRMAAFSLCQVASCYFGLQANDNYPNTKMTGIHQHIRNPETLAHIMFVLSLLSISDCKIGNQVHWVTWTGIIIEILDMLLNEKSAIARAPGKYSTYFSKVKHRIIPKIF